MGEAKKTVLVTGASRGIGRSVAVMLACVGYDVGINYAGNVKEAEETKAEVEAAGGIGLLLAGDVSQSGDVSRIYEQFIAKFGHIDALVNNAGITRDGLLLRMKEMDWDAVLNVDLKSVFLMTQHAAKYMSKQRSGAIVNMASVVGITGNLGQANYSAAKAGVIGFTKTSAKELAMRGVRVNAVAPGCIDTAMTAVIPEKIKMEMVSHIPLKRMGTAEDVAKAVRFLVSDEAAYITGQILQVDGGMVM